MPAITALAIAAAAPPLARRWLPLGRRRASSSSLSGCKNRHDAMRLAGLDDRMLADIGLNRSDLRDAFAEPLWRDPSDVLVRRAAERRAGRRRQTVALLRTPARAVRAAAGALLPAGSTGPARS